MAEDFKAGLDPHRQTAIKLLRKPEVTDEERQFGKTFNFASIYGAGPAKIATMLDAEGLTLPKGRTAKDLWNEFYALNPGIRKLSNPRPRWKDPNYREGMLEQALRTRGCIRTLWGRELHPEFEYRALNSLIQGCAADLMRCALVKMHTLLKEWEFQSHLVMSVHDELIFDVLKSEIVKLAKWVPAVMSDERIEAVVPVEVDLEVSYTTWAEKESYGA